MESAVVVITAGTESQKVLQKIIIAQSLRLCVLDLLFPLLDIFQDRDFGFKLHECSIWQI